ncbi:hypothetical protein LZT04_09675, partial [Vibrio fluvialis]|nr:hypothetical protein [Vibrio fluvialis]
LDHFKNRYERKLHYVNKISQIAANVNEIFFHNVRFPTGKMYSLRDVSLGDKCCPEILRQVLFL